jgi:hypothetical protein
VFHISHHLVSFIQAHESYLIVTQETGAEKVRKRKVDSL